MADFPHKDLTYAVIGGGMEVYNDKGFGFAEPVYQECMEIEMAFRQIAFSAQHELQLTYRGHQLQKRYIPDLIIEEKILVELKALRALTDEHRAQVLNYLKATGLAIGLLMNFGAPFGLQWERLVL